VDPSAGDDIAWFDEVGLTDRPRVGGKGASLGELARAQFRVPPGFVVTTSAFRRFRETCGAVADAGEPFAEPSSSTLRERIEAQTLPPEFAGRFFAAYERLCGGSDGDVPVAVRSSATSEDGGEASFAGLQDTFLWVRGRAAVVDALRRCWASLYSEPALAYRSRLAIAEDDMAMAVVVQRMVEPRSAGVMFTRSPLTGDRSVVAISASFGLGSTVVGGEVTPDEFVVNKITGQVARSTISCKEIRHVPDASGNGIRAEPMPEELQRRAALESDELRELTAIGRRIETHYGSAQDIEWAIDADGTIFLLQSRPETVWSARERAAADAERPLETPKDKPFQHVFSYFGPRK
jgi:pyruvate,water dikinase